MTEQTRQAAQLRPHASGDGIRFTFQGPEGIHSVAVAGTFNSWSGDAALLDRIGATTWQATVKAGPGRHHYKYVIDGRDWIRDPSNPWVSEDAQENSCFTIDDTGAVMIRLGQVSQQAPGAMYRRRSALDSPQWLKDAVIYQLSVRAFGATFAGVHERLGYLQDLGVNVIWMMPIHPIGIARRTGTVGDPYAVRDFAAIDPALGDADQLRALIAAIHARGMRIIFDWTLNRASCDNPLTASHPEWFTRDGSGQVMYAVPNRAYFAGFDFSNRALRDYLIRTMQDWIAGFDLDGMRFDDADITPLDFVNEIGAALRAVRPEIGLISQSTDELHHLDGCDLTYDGGPRAMLHRIAQGDASAADFRQEWEESTYTFPRGALRMRWLEEKEQGRAYRYFGAALHRAAAAVLLTLDGVPHLMMGQEFNEPGWKNWTSLFDGSGLDWSGFDRATFEHYQALIRVRHRHVALREGKVGFLAGGPPARLAYWRTAPQQRILVVVNLSQDDCVLPDAARSLETLFAHGLETGNGAAPALAPFGCYIGKA
jgi:glycosidase